MATMETLCGLFGKSKQAYYKHKRATISEKECESKILEIVHYYRSLMPYIGCMKLYRIVCDILGKQRSYARDKFLALMRRHKLVIPPRRPRHTTNSNHLYFKYPNCSKNLEVSHVNKLWVSDITYIPLSGGNTCYLHLVTDYYSRAIIGHTLSPTLEAKYTVMALEQAIANAGGGNLCGTTHHSDRGVQYASDAYTLLLKDHHIRISMCEDYNPTDNALAERVNGILKTEWIYRLPAFSNIQEAQEQIAHIIDLYNNVRPHWSLQHKTPMSVYRGDPFITPAARWFNNQEEEIKGSKKEKLMAEEKNEVFG